MDNIDIALLVLRVWAGVVIIAHGINHGRNLAGTANWFESKGFRQPKLNAFLSSSVEIAVGVGLILGLLTAVAAAGLAATMFVAFWSIHRLAGFFNFHRPDEGFEYVATLLFVALALGFAGAGSASLDASLEIGDDLDGWVGAGVVGMGVVAAIGQLAVFWRKPAEVEVES